MACLQSGNGLDGAWSSGARWKASLAYGLRSQPVALGAIQTIADTAIRIADVTAQQSGAVSEIRDHSERIHQLGGDNLLRIGQGREQGEHLLVLGERLDTAVQAFRV